MALEALRGDRTIQAIAAQHEVHPNQVKHLEAASDDPGPAREDRRADGGTGFFSARVQTLSRCQRLRMIERNGKLSLSRQCELLGVGRSSLYYTPLLDC